MATAPQQVVRIIRRTQSLANGTRPPMATPSTAPFGNSHPPMAVRTAPPFATSRPPVTAPSSPPFGETIRAQVVAVGTATPFAPAVPAPVQPVRKEISIVDHAAAQHALTVLCNKQTNQYRFRTTCGQLLVVLALEAMRSLPTQQYRVDGARAPWNGVAIAKPVVLLAVTRDGLSLSHNLLDCVPGLVVGSISLEHQTGSAAPQARLHLASAPALSHCPVILFDPVVQSGNSVGIALNLVRQLGATDISLVTFTIASQGLMRLQSGCPELSVWTAHVDSEWEARRGQVSVLGDFASRLFV